MFDVVKGWVDRFLSDEEAVLFAAILTASVLIILTMGDVLAPLLTGIVLAYVMQGIIKFMKRYNVPDGIAVWVTFLLFLGGFISLLVLVIPRVWRQLQSLFNEMPDLAERAQEMLNNLPEQYPGLVSKNQVDTWVEMINAEMGEVGQWLVSFSLSQIPMLAMVMVYMMLVPILVFFFLKDKDEILDWLRSYLPEKRPLMDRVGTEMNVQMSNYIRGKVVEIIIVGIATYVIFIFFGLQYAALLAFLVGLSVIVPYLGITAVSIPVVIIANLQFGWTEEFIYLMIAYSIIQALDGFVLVPLLFSEVVNLHPIAIIAAVLIFGSWWGLWGVFFAIPLATLVKAVMAAWPRNVGVQQEDLL